MKRRITALILSMTMLLGIIQFISFGEENTWETNLSDLASTTNKPATLTYVDGGININYTTSNDALAISKTKTQGNFMFESDVTFTKGNVANLIFGASKNTTSEDSFIFKLNRANKGETKVFVFSGSKGYPTISTSNANTFELNKNTYKMRVMVLDGQCTIYVDGILVASAVLPDYYADGYLGIGTAEYSSATFQNTKYTDLSQNEVSKITNIQVENMSLSPAFAENVGAYTLSAVTNETKTINVTVTFNGNADLKINGKTAENGVSAEVSLNVGKNTVAIVLVDKQTGIEIPVTISVSRQPSAKDYRTEVYRGQYHFSCNEGWLNDPNGLIYFNDQWHLFYQHIPYTTDHNGSEMHWGHAVSDDLVHWEDLPVALAPDETLGAIWSGSAVADPENISGLFAGPSENNLIAYFTSVKGGQKQSIAYSSDGGVTWTKYAKNPILDSSDDPLNDGAFRDPNVFWCEQFNTYLMVIAGGPLRIYSSDDLINWTFESGYDSAHPEYRPTGVNAITSECPDMFPLPVDGDPDNVKWIYTGAGAWYMVGDLELIDGKICYVPDTNTHYSLEFGNDAYAGVTFKNGLDGRVIMISWMNTWSYAESIPTSPWNGTMSLCYELTLKSTSNGLRIFQNPVEEYKTLRGTPMIDVKDAIIEEDGENILANCRGDQYELIAHLTPDESVTEVGFRLFKGNNYEMLVKYNPNTKVLTMNRSKVSDVKPGEYANNLACQYTVTENADGSIDLRIFVDWGSIEVIVGEGAIYGSQLLMPDFASIGMEAYSIGGDTVADITIYPLDTIWREEESTEIKEVALDIKDGSEILIGEEFTVYSRVNSRYADQRVTWSVNDPDGAVKIVAQDEYSITLKTLKVGKISITAKTADGSKEVTSNVSAVEEISIVNNKITIQPKYGAWENWGNSPNKGDLEAAAQLLIGIKLNGEKVDISSSLTWKITIVGGGQNKTITMSPTTKALEYDLYRFETCHGEGENQFIPVKDVEYTVTVKVYDGETLMYYSDPTGGFTCPVDPIYPGYKPVETIDSKVSVGAWYSKIENWNGKTYFLTGLTSSSNELLYKKLVDREWKIKLIIADETARKTYTIEEYMFDKPSHEVYGTSFMRFAVGDYGVPLETTHTYTLKVEISDNGEVIATGMTGTGAFASTDTNFLKDGQIIPETVPYTSTVVDGIFPDTDTTVTIDSNVSVGAWYSKIENWNGKTYFLTGLTSSDNEVLYSNLVNKVWQIKLIIADETAKKTYTIAQYMFDKPEHEVYGTSFMRFAVGDYGVPLDTTHAYTLKVEISKDGEIIATGMTSSGAFVSTDKNFLADGQIVPEKAPYTSTVVDGIFPDPNAKPEPKKITIQPKYGAWENWKHSPNKGDLEAALQLLVGIKLDGQKIDIDPALTWKITIVGGGQNKTLVMSPSTRELSLDLYRFETALGEGDNKFIPVKGENYTVTVEVYDGETLLYYSDAVSGFTCNLDPVYPGYNAPTTIESEVSVGAWYSKIENWNGKTYFLTGLTSSSNQLLYEKLVNKEWQIKLIIADETAKKTYTIAQYMFDKPDHEVYGTSFMRFALGDYGVPLDPTHAYTLKVEISKNGEIIATGISGTGAFVSSDTNFLNNGQIVPEKAPYTSTVVDGIFPDPNAKPEPEKITIQPKYGAWENWKHSPNKGDLESALQLLVGIKLNGEKIDIDPALTWKITIVGGGQNKTLVMSPSTRELSLDLYRFETALGEGDNKFIPVKGVNYTVTVEVYDGETLLYYSDAVSGFTCNLDPVYPGYNAPTTIESEVSVGAWYSKIENWNGKTYFLTGLTSSSNQLLYEKLVNKEWQIKLIIADETAKKTYTIAQYMFDKPDHEVYATSFMRFALGDYGVPLDPTHAYTLKVEISKNGEIIATGISGTGAFVSSDTNFLNNGQIVPETAPYTSTVVDGIFPDPNAKPEPEKITIQPKYGAWENWKNSPNKGDLESALQLLVGIKLNGQKIDIDPALTWKITIVGGGQNKTLVMSPSTRELSLDLYRFETALGEGDNKFIPVKGVNYTVTVEVYDGETLLYYSDAVSGFTCNLDPVYPGYNAPTTIESEVSVGAWYSKIENWNGKTYFLTGLTSSSNQLLYEKLVNKEWQIKLIIADETAKKTYTIAQYMFDKPDHEVYGTSFMRFALGDYGVPLDPTHAYTLKVEISKDGEIIATGMTSSGAFVSTDKNFLADGQIVPEKAPYTSTVVDGIFPEPKPEEPEVKNGFYEEDGNLYFYENGEKVTYWFEYDGKTYYASGATNVVINYNKKIQGKYYVWNDETGLEIADGFVTDENGTKCYEDGVQVIGWRHADGSGPKVVNGISEQYSSNPEGLYYFLSTTGYMVTDATYKLGGYNREFNEDHTVKPMNGLQTNAGELYYYVDGVKQTGWHTIDGTTYYFRASDAVYGRAATKWMYIGNKVYYFYASTSATPYALKDSGAIGGITYTYAEEGYIVYNGFVNCDFANAANSNTAANIQKKNGTTRYYVDGEMQTGWQQIDGNWYYFYAIGSANGSGYMCTESRKIGGVYYEFTAEGVCLSK